MVDRKKSNRRRAKKAAVSLLDSIDAIRIRHDNGSEAEHNLTSVLHIPTAPDDVLKSAREAPALIAYWGYYTERALGVVREQERQVAAVEGEMAFAFRNDGMNHIDFSITESAVREFVDQNAIVRKARETLDNLRREYGIVRAIRDAVEHKSFVLRKMISRDTRYEK